MTKRASRSRVANDASLERSIHELAELHREISQVLAEIGRTAEKWETANDRPPTPRELVQALHLEVVTFVESLFKIKGGKMDPRRGRPQWPQHKLHPEPVQRLLKLARANAEATKADEIKRRDRLMILATKLENASVSVAEAVIEAQRIRGDAEITAARLKQAIRHDRRMSQEARVKRIYTELAWDAAVDILPDTRDGRPRGKMIDAISQALARRDAPRVPADISTDEMFRLSFVRALEQPGAATAVWRIVEPEWFEKADKTRTP